MNNYEKFDTVGDLIDYLSKFPRRTKVRQEYDSFCTKLISSRMGVVSVPKVDAMGRSYTHEYFEDEPDRATFVAIVF